MRKRFILLLTIFLSALILAGCHTTPAFNEINNSVDQTQAKIIKAKNDIENPPSVVVKNGIYVDTQPQALSHKSPSWLNQIITIHGSGLPLSFYVSKITSRVDVNVSYLTSINPNDRLSLSYSGTIRGALNRIAAKTGYNYRIQGNTLTWSDMITRTFDVSFMPGTTEYLVGGQGTSTANANNSDAVYFGDLGNTKNEYSNMEADLSIWKDLNKTLNDMKSKQGKVVVSQATTTVTVYDHPQNVAMMARYIHQLNKTLTRQVALQVRVIEVDLKKDFNYGIDWRLIRRGLDGMAIGINGEVSQPVSMEPIGNNPTPAQAGFILKGLTGNWAGTNVFLNALKQQGRVSVETEPRVITLNNQVAEIGISKLQGYLESVSTTVQGTNATTTESLTPGIVKTGFSLYILPKIKGKKVYLQISSSLSRLDDIQRIQSKDTSDSNAIEVPTVFEKLFNQRSVVESGETLVIAGFKQVQNQANTTKMFNMLSSQGGKKDNIETIVLITPTVLG